MQWTISRKHHEETSLIGLLHLVLRSINVSEMCFSVREPIPEEWAKFHMGTLAIEVLLRRSADRAKAASC